MTGKIAKKIIGKNGEWEIVIGLEVHAQVITNLKLFSNGSAKFRKEKADKDGVDSFKTANGTAFLTTTDFARVEDWDATLEFIKGNDAYDLLEKRVSKTAVRGYIEANKSVPSGVNYGTRIDVNIRKPSIKAED